MDAYVHTQEFLFQLADEARELLKQVALSL
jgi:hypothetical protein